LDEGVVDTLVADGHECSSDGRDVALWIVLSVDGDPWMAITLATLGGPLAMIGPGAWSIDAQLFGRKHILTAKPVLPPPKVGASSPPTYMRQNHSIWGWSSALGCCRVTPVGRSAGGKPATESGRRSEI
jgi:hypothetical protein